MGEKDKSKLVFHTILLKSKFVSELNGIGIQFSFETLRSSSMVTKRKGNVVKKYLNCR